MYRRPKAVVTCEDYRILTPNGECVYYDVEVYSAGVARFCKLRKNKLVYYMTDCPESPNYSLDSSKQTIPCEEYPDNCDGQDENCKKPNCPWFEESEHEP